MRSFFSFFFSYQNNEQGNSNNIYQIEDFVVTASRFEQTLSDLSPSVSYFHKEAIENGHYLNLRDVLIKIPGVHLCS